MVQTRDPIHPTANILQWKRRHHPKGRRSFAKAERKENGNVLRSNPSSNRMVLSTRHLQPASILQWKNKGGSSEKQNFRYERGMAVILDRAGEQGWRANPSRNLCASCTPDMVLPHMLSVEIPPPLSVATFFSARILPSTTSTSDLKPTSPILANLFGGRSGGRRSRVWRGGGGVDCDAAKKLALVTCVATNTISVLQLAVARTCSTTAAPALQSVRPYCHTQSVSRVDNPALHFYPHLPMRRRFFFLKYSQICT